MIDSKIVYKVLQQTQRLTLPEFGTLLKKNDGEIVFSQFLKTEDMVLTSVVMNSYHVGLDEAKQMVAEFVSDIMSKIATSGHYVLPEIGYLEATSSGAVKLKSGFPPQQFVTPQHPQVTPQPIVGIPQQQTHQFRQQTPYSPRPQQVIPQRNSQQRNSQQRPQQQRPQQQRPQQVQRTVRQPVHRNMKPAVNKTDYWLLISIIAAVIVIAIIVYSLFFAESATSYIG